MGTPYTQDEFLRKLKDKKIKYIPLGKYINSHTKIKWTCYKNNKHTFESEPSNIYDGKEHCPYCMRKKAFVGETDLWTERPDIASLLLNPEDGYKYLSTGGQKVDFVCPRCNRIIKKKIGSVTRYGFSCSYCSDNISFSEKIVRNLLIQLKCDFLHDRTTDWSGNKRYDFYIPNINLIIETHGAQHYTTSFRSFNSCRNARTCEEEIENDKYKRELALSNGVKYYIELDCRYSDFDYIKKSILNSQLSEIFDLSIIEWHECFKSTTTSDIILCANLWGNGLRDTKSISKQTGIHISSVISHLKKASQLGLCDYVPNYNKNKRKQDAINKVCELWNSGITNLKEISVITNMSYSYISILIKICREQNLFDDVPKDKRILCVETGKIYDSTQSVKDDGYSLNAVIKVCNGTFNTHHNLHFNFI